MLLSVQQLVFVFGSAHIAFALQPSTSGDFCLSFKDVITKPSKTMHKLFHANTPTEPPCTDTYFIYFCCRRFLRETLKMSNAEDLNRLTACSLVLLGHIFYVLGNHRVRH